MEDKPKLTVITTPKLKRPTTFWEVCPRTLSFLPESVCLDGKPIMNDKSKRVQEEPRCAWWINSKEHNYCFWKYLKAKSNVDGVMPELVQSDLAQLFGWSNTKTHFILKEAIAELTNAFQVFGAVDLLKEIDEEDFNILMSSANHRESEVDSYE